MRKLFLILFLFIGCGEPPWMIYKDYSDKLQRISSEGRLPHFSQDGKKIYFREEKGIYSMNIFENRSELIIKGDIYSFDLHPNDGSIIIVERGKNILKIYDRNGNFIENIEEKFDRIEDICYASNGNGLYVIGRKDTLKGLFFLDLQTHKADYKIYYDSPYPGCLNVYKDSLICIGENIYEIIGDTLVFLMKIEGTGYPSFSNLFPKIAYGLGNYPMILDIKTKNKKELKDADPYLDCSYTLSVDLSPDCRYIAYQQNRIVVKGTRLSELWLYKLEAEEVP